MEDIRIHGKKLPVPSFFQVFNYGGGGGDKTREVIYADLTDGVPALFNYFYICSEYPCTFRSRRLNDLSGYETMGDVFNDIREKTITEEGTVYGAYPVKKCDFNKRVLLLDSGAANIVKQLAEETDYNTKEFETKLKEHMKRYYDFAERYRFDIVVGFDLGGKYTFKDGETHNPRLIQFYDELDKDGVNLMLLEESIKYLKKQECYYPYVLATVHGETPVAFKRYTDAVLMMEQKYEYSFWGFALGGIAGSKSLDGSWLEDIDFTKTKKKYVKEAAAPARAAKIVRERVGDRPIHALGCGGYPNISMNYFCGATSFDSASPARRAGDGGDLSVLYVHDKHAPKKVNGKNIGFSKMHVGGFDTMHKMKKEEYRYLRLCEVEDDMELCGCSACRFAKYVKGIKDLYAKKETDLEAHYLSRQLMNAHAVNQHQILCEIVREYESMKDFCEKNDSDLNRRLFEIYKQICK